MQYRAKLEFLQTVTGDFLDDGDLAADYPFAHQVTLAVGIEASDGSEIAGSQLYNLDICNPAWVVANCSEGRMLIGRHMLLVGKTTSAELEKRISRFLFNCVGDSISDTYERVSRFGRSEYEDFDQNELPVREI